MQFSFHSTASEYAQVHFWEVVWIDFLIYFCLLILDYFYENEDRTDEEAEPTFSEDEALTQRGVRRSQSVKITRSRARKDVRLRFLPHTFAVFLYCIKTIVLSAGSLWIIEDKRQEKTRTELR